MSSHVSSTDLRVLIRGADEQASGIAHRLFRSRVRVALTEIAEPIAVRRAVSFCEAIWYGRCRFEGVAARQVESPGQIDPTSAKRNVGTKRGMASLVIGFGLSGTCRRAVLLLCGKDATCNVRADSRALQWVRAHEVRRGDTSTPVR